MRDSMRYLLLAWFLEIAKWLTVLAFLVIMWLVFTGCARRTVLYQPRVSVAPAQAIVREATASAASAQGHLRRQEPALAAARGHAAEARLRAQQIEAKAVIILEHWK